MKRQLVLHPFLFGLYPVLFLYSRNLNLDLGWGFVRPGLVVLGAITGLWLLLALGRVSREKAGLLISVGVLMLFSFGPVDDRLPAFTLSLGGLAFGKSKVLFALWTLMLGAAAFFIARASRDLSRATVIANATAAILIAFPLLTMLMNIRMPAEDSRVPEVTLVKQQVTRARTALPHVYYIILDGYGRADVLKELYDYDNAAFLDRLAELDFYIAEGSTANYPQTVLSLASSLNFRYLEDIAAGRSGSDDREPLMDMIRRNGVMEHLRNYNYQFVAFTSGYSGAEIRDADVNLQYSGLTEFESVLFNMTPFPEVLWALKLYDDWEVHRRRTMYILDHLADTTSLETPSFIFAHMISPHPPFVFGADGEKIHQREINAERFFTFADGADLAQGPGLDEYRRSYSKQAEFIGGRIVTAIEQIMANSRVPPIIILQGDHGPSSLLASDLSNPNEHNLRERLPILNAYYLPGGATEHLYPAITPVNSFRVVLNHFFDGDYEVLPDANFFATWVAPYELEDVTDIVQ